MKTDSSPLDRAASLPQLRKLVAADALRADEARRMAACLRADLPWRLWLDRGLLILGVMLIVAGIGYFFAHNWRHLTENDKLVLAAGSVLIAFVGSVYAGLDRFAGKLLLLAASLLVGVFISVFGQVYQTGADTYELFLAWTLLILPWVLLGRFVPLWLFCLALINLTIGFYWPISLYFFSDSFDSLRCFRYESGSLLAVNLLALCLREAAASAKITWIDRDWSAWLLLTATLIPVTAQAIYEILRTYDNQPDISGLPAFFSVLFLSALILGLSYYFFRVRPSLPALALNTLSTCSVVTVLMLRLIIPRFESDMLLLMGFLVLAVFGGGVYLLRVASRFISH